MSSTTSLSTRPYQPATLMAKPKPVVETYDVSESNFWASKFGLGGRGGTGKFAHPRCLVLKVGSASMVHAIVMGATAGAINLKSVSSQLLTAACGPRVPLYGTTPQSAFIRALGQHSKSSTTTSSTNTTASSAATVDPDRHIPMNGQMATAASLRTDGRLLAVGTDRGVVVSDTTTRATLVSFTTTSNRGSNSSPLPVRAVAWFRNGQHILAAGDDAVLRVWRLKGASASGKGSGVVECVGHGDAIRAAGLWQNDTMSIAATGSYDHTVRLWDMNGLDNEDKHSVNNTSQPDDRCTSVLEHGAPVEAVHFIKSTNPDVPVWLVSAGGTNLKVWNPVTGVCVCTLRAQHRKTISCLLSMPRKDMVKDTVTMRLVTGGLDGLLRIHTWDAQTGSLQFLHGVNLNSGSQTSEIAITALAATSNGERLAIGTASGTILVRQKGPSIKNKKRTKEPRAGTYSFFNRGMNVDPLESDHVVESGGKKLKLQAHDISLKQFRYGDALDEALQTRIPQTIVAVLEELGKRRGLKVALSNRDEEGLAPLLSFMIRYISRPRFSALLIGVANILIDIYEEVIGQSATIDKLFAKLRMQVSDEVRTQKLLLRVVGQVEAILTQAEMNR